MQQTEEALTNHERFKELMKRKKKLLAKIRRNKKEAVKARIEKAKINEELRLLKGKKNLFVGMSTEEAREKVRMNIEAVSPEQIYPKDLERQFDTLDKPKAEQHKTLDLGKVAESPLAARPRDDDDSIVGEDHDEQPEGYEDEEAVIDLSNE